MTWDSEETAASKQEDEAVWRLASALASATSADEVAEALVQEGATAASGSFANMAVLEPDSEWVRVIYRSTAEVGVTEWRIFELQADLPVCEAMRSGLAVLLGSRQEIRQRYPLVSAEIEAAGLQARASLPLHSAEGATLGVVGFGWDDSQEFTVPQLRRLDLISQLAGLALDRAVNSGQNIETHSLPRALESMPNAFFSLDFDLRFTSLNTEAERLLGSSRGELIGSSLLEAFPEVAGSEFHVRYREAIDQGRSVRFEGHYAPLDSWFEVRAWPDRLGLNVAFSDISERRQIEAERAAALSEAERANARLTFLTELAARLTGATTRAEVLERLSGAVVPTMADWCTLVVPQGEELVRIAAVHRDPALDRLAKRLVGSYSHHFSGPSPGVVVYQSGQPLRLDRLAQQIIADLDDSAASAAYGRTLVLLGDGPGLIAPVSSRGEVVAVLTMVRSSGSTFKEDEMAMVTDAMAMVAVSLEQASHVEAEREAAAALQEAALPKTLPQVGGIRLAAGYRPASEGSQVGGDWYDAFVLPTGCIALVVGDAAGHGLRAAAAMAQMRNTLRANLFSALGPAQSLSQLNELLVVQDPDVFGTIICAEVDPGTGEAIWASAGHPAPILVSGDGRSRHLRGQPGPPIGWAYSQAAQPAMEHRLVLHSLDRLILFTDGLFERRGDDVEIGLTHLMILAEQSRHGADVDRACTAILAGMLSASHEDDACLLVADFILPPAD